MKRIQQSFLLLIFGCLLALPMLNDAFSFFRFERINENRKYADSLPVNFSKLDKFPKDCEAYVNDNFSFRPPFIDLYRKTKLKLFRVSPFPDLVTVGKNGRYFMPGDEMIMYRGERNFSTEQLQQFEVTWKRRKAYFDSLGIAVYIIPAPTSNEIYSEQLPMNIKRTKHTHRISQLEKYTSKSLPGLVINLLSDLRSAKKTGEVYFKLDHHWTEIGGYTASKKVLTQLKKDHFPDLDISFLKEYRWKTETRDIGYFAGILNDGTTEYYPVAYGHRENAEATENLKLDYFSENVSDYDKQTHYINKKSPNKKRLLVIRDSFGVATYPFLKEAFSESVFIHDAWNYVTNKKVVEAYKPDVVIYVVYDYYLDRIINSPE